MGESNDTWVVLVVSAMTMLVVGLLLFDDAAWYVQYPILAVSLLLSILAVSRAEYDSSAA